TLMRKTLGEALELNPADNHFCIFRDHLTGLEYIRNNKQLYEQGLYVELHAYKCQVFFDFRQVQDNEWHQYAHLAAYLDGRGVPSMDEALKEIFLRPIHYPFKELVNANFFGQLLAARVTSAREQLPAGLLEGTEQKLVQLFRAAHDCRGGAADEGALAHEVRQRLEAARQLPVLADISSWPAAVEYKPIANYLKANLSDELRFWAGLFSWVFVHSLGRIHG